MLKNRWFNVVILVALLVVAALLIHQTFATAQTVSATTDPALNLTSSVPSGLCPFTPEEIRSIHAVYVNSIGVWLPRSTQGYTGIEGGMHDLRYCLAPGQ